MRIVDASVALKWVLEEDGSDRARALLESEILVAPDLLWLECANVLWVKVRRGVLDVDEAKAAMHAMVAAPVQRVGGPDLVVQAQSIGVALNQSIYDCFYLAVAFSLRCAMVTADHRFAAAAQAHVAYRDWVIAL
jgi:predicted nucleic acid-binding protein